MSKENVPNKDLLNITNLNTFTVRYLFAVSIPFALLTSKIISRLHFNNSYDRTENACTVSTFRCPIQSLEKFSKALYEKTGGTHIARILSSCHVFVCISYEKLPH